MHATMKLYWAGLRGLEAAAEEAGGRQVAAEKQTTKQMQFNGPSSMSYKGRMFIFDVIRRTCVCVCVFVCLCVCLFVCLHVCLFVCMCVEVTRQEKG